MRFRSTKCVFLFMPILRARFSCVHPLPFFNVQIVSPICALKPSFLRFSIFMISRVIDSMTSASRFLTISPSPSFVFSSSFLIYIPDFRKTEINLLSTKNENSYMIDVYPLQNREGYSCSICLHPKTIKTK